MADPSRPVTGYPAYPDGRPPPVQAYPYTAPPPYPNNNPYPYRPRPTFLRAFIVGIIVFFIVMAVISFIVWLVVRPHLPEFHVDSLQVSNFSLASQSLSASWVVGFSVYNPNKKMIISYDNVESSIFYKSEYLSESRIAPFTQGKRNLTSVTASFFSSNSYIDGWAFNEMNGDRARGAVSFNVKVLARVSFRAGGWRPRRRLLRVLCLDLAVGIPSSNNSASGKLLRGPMGCRVGI